jgi:hypothetical protein
MDNHMKIKVTHTLKKQVYDDVEFTMDSFGHIMDDTPLIEGYTPFCIRCGKCDHFMEKYCPGTPSCCTKCWSRTKSTIHYVHYNDKNEMFLTNNTDKPDENVYRSWNFTGDKNKLKQKVLEINCSEFNDKFKPIYETDSD